jgi:predicted HicB family RNase H-like nuclease
MKKVVNGVAYNTDTSALLAKKEFDEPANTVGQYEPPYRGSETLYKTRGGAYFIVEEGEREVWNQAEEQDTWRPYCTFKPVSADKAQAWLLEGKVEIFHNPFDEIPEATAESVRSATLYLRLTDVVKAAIDEMARAEGISANAWAARCLQNCITAQRKALEGAGQQG